MPCGLGLQFESRRSYIFQQAVERRLWKRNFRYSHRHEKAHKTRYERHRAKLDPECQPLYGRYGGYEW